MTGVVIDVTLEGFAAVSRTIGRLTPVNRALVLDGVGQIVEQQTKRRIASEKAAPDGTAWKPNRRGTSILVQDGFLRDSIHHVVEAVSVRIGSNLIYAAIHQVGGTIRPVKGRLLVFMAGDRKVAVPSVTIPARPYLGISKANGAQIERHLVTMIGAQLNG